MERGASVKQAHGFTGKGASASCLLPASTPAAANATATATGCGSTELKRADWMRVGRIMAIDHFPVRALPLSRSKACQLTRGPGALAPWLLLQWPVPARIGAVPSKVGQANGHSPLASEGDGHEPGPTVLGTRYLGRDMSPTALCAYVAEEMISTSPSQVPCTYSRTRVGGRPLPCRSLLGLQLRCNSQLQSKVGAAGRRVDWLRCRQRCVSLA
jgi:hypothetical protein